VTAWISHSEKSTPGQGDGATPPFARNFAPSHLNPALESITDKNSNA